LFYVSDVTVGNGLAYVAMDDDGMAIVDVRNGAAPAVLSETAFMVEGESLGSNRDRPAIVAEIALDAPVAHYAYIAALGFGDGGLAVVDVSDPTHPKEVGFLQLRMPPSMRNSGTPTPLPPDDEWYFVQPRGVAMVGSWVYLATSMGIFGVDVTDPTAPRLLSPEALWHGWAVAIDGDGSSLAVVGVGGTGPGNGVWLLDAEPDGQLTERHFVSLTNNVSVVEVTGVALKGDTIAVSDGEGGVAVVNTASEERPLKPVWFPIPEDSVDVTWADDGLLYVGHSHNDDGPDHHSPPPERKRGVRVVDTSQSLDAPNDGWSVGSITWPKRVVALDVAAGFVFVANGSDGLAILDTRQVAGPGQTATSAATSPTSLPSESSSASATSVPSASPTEVAPGTERGAPVFLPLLFGGLGLVAASVIAFRRNRTRRIRSK
jgi:hypothetical protein